jgi:hypothetical protein
MDMKANPCNGSMRFYFRRATWAALAVAITAWADEAPMVQRMPLIMGASLQWGQAFGVDPNKFRTSTLNSMVPLHYTTVWMMQEATIEHRLKVDLGFGGIFFYPFPEDPAVGYTSYRSGGVAISVASATYGWGDLRNPGLQMVVGQFPFKYNPEVKNLGEYLFRSESYPTIVRSGDWGAIDNAKADLWGMDLGSKSSGGLFRNDFLLTMANEQLPLYDVSVTDVAAVNIGGIFEIGGGIQLSRVLPVAPSKTHPLGKKQTGYFTWTARDQAELRAQIAKNPALSDTGNAGLLTKKYLPPGGSEEIMAVDTSLEVGKTYWMNDQRPAVVFATGDPSLRDLLNPEYLTFQSVKIMARASLDIKPWLGLGSLGKDDLKLYAESAILGIKDYPIFYNKMSDRMPIMVGFNVPTFGLLDYLTLEAERFTSPYINSTVSMKLFRYATPKTIDGEGNAAPIGVADPRFNNVRQPYTEDDIKWSITAAKKIENVMISAQAGRDHFRPITGSFEPEWTELTATKNSWYYMTKLQVDI